MKKILYLLFLLCSSFSYAQLAQVRVSPIPSISQLPVSAISCIYEDSEGYMWYGTVDGLCRDDGYSVHVFRSDFHTPGLMAINSVLSIDGDRNNRIWFGTQKGVYILDKNTCHHEDILEGASVRSRHSAQGSPQWGYLDFLW